MTLEQEYQVQQFALDAQMAAYDHFDVNCAPSSQEEYDKMVDYIVEVIRKTNWWDLLTEDCVEIAETVNAHMAASAFEKVLNGQR